MSISESPVVSVHIPPALRDYTDGQEEVMASGETIGEILAAVAHRCPALGEQLLCRDGGLVSGLRVYLGGNRLDVADVMETEILLEETVSLVVDGDLACGPDSGGNQRRAKRPSEAPADGEISIGT